MKWWRVFYLPANALVSVFEPISLVPGSPSAWIGPLKGARVGADRARRFSNLPGSMGTLDTTVEVVECSPSHSVDHHQIMEVDMSPHPLRNGFIELRQKTLANLEPMV